MTSSMRLNPSVGDHIEATKPELAKFKPEHFLLHKFRATIATWNL
jgi:hypothetical protein